MIVRTGLFGMDPWQSGAEEGLAAGWAELAVDPIGAPCAALHLWLPHGYGHDDREWTGGRWLRIDPVDAVVEYLVDLDDGLCRAGSWSLDGHGVVLEELRHPVGEDDLRYAFAVMAEVATELRIAPLPDDLAAEHAGVPLFDAALTRPRWSPPR